MDVEKFKQLLNEMLDLYQKKNHDYGGSITDTYNKYGPLSFSVRMRDKLNRFDTLASAEDAQMVHGEKIHDTLIDLANYALLAIIEEERERKAKTNS